MKICATDDSTIDTESHIRANALMFYRYLLIDLQRRLSAFSNKLMGLVYSSNLRA